MKSQRTHAFTLIELLVVISIISLLVAILLPSLAAARDRAQFIQCAANLRSVGTANLLYAQDHQEYLAPWVTITQGDYNADKTWRNRYGALLLIEQGYMTSGKILHSPSDKGRDYAFSEAGWKLFLGSQGYPGNSASSIRTAYVFREPAWISAETNNWQMTNPSGSAFYAPFRLADNARPANFSMIADRFSGNYIWSFHQPQGRTSSQPNTAGINGQGWHVTFTDGHTSFYQNTAGTYVPGNPYVAAGGWPDRYRNWNYWDNYGH